MQRLNRSTRAPVGTALFLFVGLAILPVSLRAAGVQVGFNPKLSAAMDAWHQIAEVFGASYHPVPTSELSVVKDFDNDPSNTIERSVSVRGSEFACAETTEEWAGTVIEVPKVSVCRVAPALRAYPKSELRRPPAADRAALFVATDAIKARFEKHVPAIASLGAMRLEMLTREHLMRDIERTAFRQSFEPMGEIRNLPVTKNVRVLVRIKRAAAGLSSKPAECKVFAALASSRRHECDRAILTSTPSGSPDNSEF